MVCPYCKNSTQVVNSRPQKTTNSTWRRRKCTSCGAIFSTIEQIDWFQAVSVRRTTSLEPFDRDILFLSIHGSLRHRTTAIRDATALTHTVMAKLRQFINQGTIDIEHISEITAAVLDNFDIAAATAYRAFHLQ